MTLRKRWAQILQTHRYQDRFSLYFDWFLIGLIVLNVLDVILESVREFHQEYATEMFWFELFSIVVFTVEYLLRIWSCVDV